MKTGKILAAGIIAIDKMSGKILLVKRSDQCPQPYTWANVGGKMDPEDETIKKTAIREFKEEVQPDEPFLVSKKPFFVNSDNFLTFYTFLGLFENKFVPVLNEENIEAGWFDLDELPEHLMPACKLLFDTKRKDLERFISIHCAK